MLTRTVYLSGPMDNCTDEELHGWRDRSKEFLYPHFTIDPARRDYRTPDGTISDKELVEIDKVDIQDSNGVLVHFIPPAQGSFMTGTTMEIIYAHSLSKLVVTVVPPDFFVSPWIKYHSSYVVTDLKEGCDIMKAFWDKQVR